MSIVELRQYTLHPGKVDLLIDLFETEFIETQEAAGIEVVGQFRDLDKPDRFVWIRRFEDMRSRAEALKTFYEGPAWQAHSELANSTMVDSDDVLLLREAAPDSDFAIDRGRRPARGATKTPGGIIVAHICYFDAVVPRKFRKFFHDVMQPSLSSVGVDVLASYVTETSPNTFPRLPVREADRVFVWFASFKDDAAYRQRMKTVVGSDEWNRIAGTLRGALKGTPEVLRLQPTPRSLLHHEIAQ